MTIIPVRYASITAKKLGRIHQLKRIHGKGIDHALFGEVKLSPVGLTDGSENPCPSCLIPLGWPIKF